ncbi:MAG: hypothetical protein SPJ69_00840 [Campylobacter sp.]|uniref:hypothetical protein n=1 Tax=Campylobacter sp. TaxID=205 RepID=UPI002976A6AB|nr:hypothetical protein [Campylobacter sp.]MDD7599829.1 hypothetical protein [Campylobacteraceae bacterium]MDY5886845.1 hypothetical protein [Campylobacter sp.]
MYEENDLYNLDFDENSTSETANADKQTEQAEPKPERAEPEQAADNKNPLWGPEPQKAQDSTATKNQLTDEQIAYIEKARQRDELERVVNDIKSRIPSFDMEAISKELLKMKDEEVRKYYTPQGLELLWYERFARGTSANNPQVDGSHTSSSGESMDDLAKKVAAGTASMDEEREFYIRLGKIGQSDY